MAVPPGAWLEAQDVYDQYGETRVRKLIATAIRGDLAALDPSEHDDEIDRVLGEVIAAAEGQAKSRLRTRYGAGELPTAPADASEALKRVTADLFWWQVHKRFELISDDVKEIRDGAMRELADLVHGGASLLLAGDPPVDDSRPTVLTKRRPATVEPALSMETLREW